MSFAPASAKMTSVTLFDRDRIGPGRTGLPEDRRDGGWFLSWSLNRQTGSKRGPHARAEIHSADNSLYRTILVFPKRINTPNIRIARALKFSNDL